MQDTGSSSNSSIGTNIGISRKGSFVSGNIRDGSSESGWVSQQSSIIAKEKLEIRVEDHTQVDGAVIASKTGDMVEHKIINKPQKQRILTRGSLRQKQRQAKGVNLPPRSHVFLIISFLKFTQLSLFQWLVLLLVLLCS